MLSKLAVRCYKEEIETVFRSRLLGGFQILDIQDFSGQGTALVGVLDAFMDSKGLITDSEWREFCNDAVVMARFDSYVFEAGSSFKAHAELCNYRPELKGGKLICTLALESGEVIGKVEKILLLRAITPTFATQSSLSHKSKRTQRLCFHLR